MIEFKSDSGGAGSGSGRLRKYGVGWAREDASGPVMSHGMSDDVIWSEVITKRV